MKIKRTTIILLLIACLCLSALGGTAFFAEENEKTDYLATIPHAAYHGYTSFTEIPQELLNYYDYGITSILFDELFRLNIIPEKYKTLQHYPSEGELASSLKIPVSELKNIVDRLYGKGAGDRAIIGQEFHHRNAELHLWPLEKEDAYAFCPAIYQGSPGLLYHSKQLDSEIVGENLIIRSIYAEWNYGEDADWNWEGSVLKIPITIYSVENSFSERNYNILATWIEKGGTKKVESRIRGGEFDEYLPVYKHTFKPNGDGTYYWARTELETPGKGVPSSMFDEEQRENFLESLLDSVPKDAYRGFTTFADLPQERLGNSYYGISSTLIEELYHLNVLPKEYEILQREPTATDLASCLRVSVSDLKNIVDRLYGKGAGDRAIIGQRFSSGVDLHLWYLEKEGAYVFCPAIFSKAPKFKFYTKKVDSELVGEDLIVRSVYAEWTVDNTAGLSFYSVENSFKTNNYKLLATWKKVTTLSPDLSVVQDQICSGEFDEYLPVYKHTFKPNGDGTYYWAQTELETAGKEIPLSVIDPSAKEENTDTSTATDVSTNTVTDAITDVSTGTATDVVPQEEGSSVVRIVVAVVAVAAVAAAAVFFVLKKKKA